jgi:5-methyltetrahydropteroyltriglutamate--homocysteine methyltransferase
MVVLGLVTTKSGRRETVEELERRAREAAALIDLERLAISPQCGFRDVGGRECPHAGRRAREAGDDRARGGRHLGMTVCDG